MTLFKSSNDNQILRVILAIDDINNNNFTGENIVLQSNIFIFKNIT